MVEFDFVFGCGPQIAWLKCWHRNWLGFCVGGRNRLDFSVEDRSFLTIKIDPGFESVTVYRLPIRLPAKSALTWPVV